MQDGVESPASKSSELEKHGAYMYLPAMREGVYRNEGIWAVTEILQRCLLQQGQGCGEEKDGG